MSKNLLQNRIRLAEYARSVWCVTPEPSVSFEEILKPEYWTHVSKQLLPGARIEVLPEDHSWFAELIVRSSTNNETHVAVLRHVKLDAPQPATEAEQAKTAEPYEIKHRGGAGWSVIRKVDKTVLYEKGQSRAEAERFLDEQAA